MRVARAANPFFGFFPDFWNQDVYSPAYPTRNQFSRFDPYDIRNAHQSTHSFQNQFAHSPSYPAQNRFNRFNPYSIRNAHQPTHWLNQLRRSRLLSRSHLSRSRLSRSHLKRSRLSSFRSGRSRLG